MTWAIEFARLRTSFVTSFSKRKRLFFIDLSVEVKNDQSVSYMTNP